MAVEGLSNQELLGMIVTFAAVAMVFALVFVVSLVRLVRKRRKPLEENVESPSQPDWGQKSPAGGRRETMSLLKAMAKNTDRDSLPPQSYETLLTVLVDSSTHEIVVDVDGQRFRSISQVKSRSIGQRILETTAALLKFTGGFVATSSGTKSYPIPDVTLTSLPIKDGLSSLDVAPSLVSLMEPETGSPVEPEEVADSMQAKFLADLEARTRVIESAAETESAKPRWGGRRSKPDSNEGKKPVATGFNLADEIDQLVQQKLQQANELTVVKIDSGAVGQIVIWVGGKSYEMVDDIEDGNVKTIIQAAIKEWSDSR